MTKPAAGLRWISGGVFVAALMGSALALPGLAAAQGVTTDELKAAAPENWLLPYQSYNATSYSPLDEINVGNVGKLSLKFMTAIGGSQPAKVGGVSPGQRATPIVRNGFMYVTNAWEQVMKIDVSSGTAGKIVWVSDLGAEGSTSKMGAVALLGDAVYYGTRTKRTLVKIDEATGDVLWEVPTAADDDAPGMVNTAGILAVNDKIIVGSAGPATRGWVAAYSAEDGELLWRTYTVPGPGEAGHETWADDHDAYMTGGAGVWSTPSYDAEQNLVIVGTGEAQPWGDPAFHPGDNLYANSEVAFDADTGEIKWYFQELAQETWDYDTINMKMLYDIEKDGKTQKVMGTFSRNGFFYTIDRETGKFVMGTAYREPNWTAGLDPVTGKPVEYKEGSPTQEYAPKAVLKVGAADTAQNICPMLATATWWPPAYSPDSKIAYITATDACFSQSIEANIDPTRTDLRGNPGMWGGGNFWKFQGSMSQPLSNGLIIGVNTETGEKVQEVQTPTATNSGLLATKGGLLFLGHPDGRLVAYDQKDLSEVWSFNVGTPIGAPPISYSVGGKQFIAVVTGGSSLPTNPATKDMKQTAQVVFFAL